MLESIMKESDMLSKKDFEENPSMNVKSPAITKKIFEKAGSADPIAIIKAIEDVSDELKLNLKHRIPYTINAEGNVYINVAKAIVEGDYVIAIGWNVFGMGRTKYDADGTKSQLPDVSTHVIPKNKITCVTFGTYDDSKIKVFDDSLAKADTSFDLVKLLTVLRNEINAKKSAGMHRSIITLINMAFKTNDLNDSGKYKLNPQAYKMYLELKSIYTICLHDVVRSFVDKGDNSNSKETHRFVYFKDEETMKKIIEAHAKHDTTILPDTSFRQRIDEENCFTFSEVALFGEAIGIDVDVSDDVVNYDPTYVKPVVLPKED